MMVPAGHYLALAAALFTVGVVGVLLRRSLIVIFMSIELMLNSVNLTLVSFARINGNLDGQVLSFFVMVVAAAEVTVGLALIVNLFRLKASVDADDVDALRA
ncbi:MAG TPA: NADH-quinone oxidoreductase subunit NuoK [Egibacteraceae bacterium]|jgi:NADH-quinone oxidoreductase subunit K|nr:NADH-quinone oxidoreductase subunit NuoK [Egibacteraceae bacterium]